MTSEPTIDPRPRSERILQGLARTLLSRRRAVLSGLALAAVALWLATGFYAVENGSVALVRRFGAVLDEEIPPGLHYRFPNGIDREDVFPSGEVRRIEVAGDIGEKLDVITGDENIVATSLVVQFKVTDVAQFLFASEGPAELVAQSVRAALLEVAGSMQVDDLLTTGKARIQNDVRARAQELLRSYGAGVSLLAVTLQSIDPPTEAAAAFRSVQDSRSEAARTVSDGQMLADHMLSLTRAEASSMVEEAAAEAEARVLEARGAADRFRALAEQHRRSPEQTKADLWRAQIERSLPRVETIILAPGERPAIDVHLRSKDPAPGS